MGKEKSHIVMQPPSGDQENKEMKPVKPIPAATVILAREHSGELQVYLLRRSSKSGFMAGHYVFPGGMVDHEDQDPEAWAPRVDLDPESISRRLGGDRFPRADALAHGVAAIRETLEEAGAFLVRGEGPSVSEMERIHEMRMSGNPPPGWFRKWVSAGGWPLGVSALSPWSHWITPTGMKRRYDTRFFLAPAPDGQVCRPDSRETTIGLWISPGKGLEKNLTGEIPLSPPTLVTLHELLKHRSLEEARKEAETRRWPPPIMPRLIPLDKGAMIIEPWDPEYDRDEIDIDADDLAAAVTPVGQPFSRIWLSQGVFRPVNLLHR